MVDDDPEACRLAVELLEAQGMVATAASTIAAARAELAKDAFDLVLSDVRLPDSLGAVFTDYLRQHAPETATILVDDEPGVNNASTALAKGVDDFLTRPFSGEQLAIAVARALRRRAERTGALVESQAGVAEDVLDCLIKAGRFRDEETSEHVERVSRTCGLIAKELGWSAADCGTLRAASAMHDIGKVGVPDAVLRKPGKLTAHERASIERHAQIGYDILSGSNNPVLELAATIALSHHERIDGDGYPKGLAGDDIPLEGRITAVADVFDALTNDRVYRSAATAEDALELMQAGDGTQFDSRMLAAFREVLPQVEEVGALYPDATGAAPDPEVVVPTEPALRVLVIEDHGAVARGLALLLKKEGMEVAGTAATLAEAERLIESRDCDVAILDVNLQGESGFGLIPKARARGMRVLLYTGEALPSSLAHPDKGDGIASKAGGPAELIKAVREVAAGGSPVDSRVILRTSEARLTAREQEIIGFLAQGVSGEEIAERLFLSAHTVRTHVRNAMAKTQAKTRAHLVALSAEAGEATSVGS